MDTDPAVLRFSERLFVLKVVSSSAWRGIRWRGETCNHGCQGPTLACLLDIFHYVSLGLTISKGILA